MTGSSTVGVLKEVAHSRLPVLDGVRAISIVAVLITHLVPVKLGKTAWNDSVGMFGMALFFILSGFLIANQLLQRPTLRSFAARRLFRVLPAAWLCIGLVWLFVPMEGRAILSNLLFYANLPPSTLVPPIDHFWSLCVEVQFYVFAMALLWLRPGFVWWALPAALMTVTALRIGHEVTASSITWYRADDLLAGAALALIVNSRFAPRFARYLGSAWTVWALLLIFSAACVIPKSGSNWLAYLRPYAAALFVGALISQPGAALSRVLGHASLGYVASVSYALYVWHLPLAATWLGSGELLEKYLKRPLLLLVLFLVAHVSTFYFEHRFVAWGKRFGRGSGARACNV